MRLLIDGNIVIDVLANRTPHVEDSSKIWKLCETGLLEGRISALTFANLVYVMRRELDAETIRDVLDKLSLIFGFENLNARDLHEAAKMGWRDFEDAIQAVTAKRIHADYIITRNVKDFSQSDIPAITPSEFLDMGDF